MSFGFTNIACFKKCNISFKAKILSLSGTLIWALYIFIYDAYEDIIYLFIESFSYNNYDEIMLIHFVV